MYDKVDYPKTHYQFYRKGSKNNIKLNNHQNNYRYNMNNQQSKEMRNQINNTISDNTIVDQNLNDFQHKKDRKKKIMLGNLVIRAGLDYLYPKDAQVLYGILLANKKLLRIKPELAEICREVGKSLRRT